MYSYICGWICIHIFVNIIKKNEICVDVPVSSIKYNHIYYIIYYVYNVYMYPTNFFIFKFLIMHVYSPFNNNS